MSAEEMQRELYLDDGKSSVGKDSSTTGVGRDICLQGSSDLPADNVVSLALWRAGKGAEGTSRE